MAEILFKELSYEITGAAMEVHRTLGPGFLEAVYQKALTIELSLRNIPYEEYKVLPVFYKNQLIGEYEADIVVAENIILELKAVTEIHPKHLAQAVHYLAATGYSLALILNFGSDSLQTKRVVRKNSHQEIEKTEKE